MEKVSTKDSEPITLLDASMFAQTLRHTLASQELNTDVQAVHVSTNKVSRRLLNDKCEIVTAGKGGTKFRKHPEIQLQIGKQGEANVINWVPTGHQLFTFYGKSNEGETNDQGNALWIHRDMQLSHAKEGTRHDKEMVRKGGKSSEGIRNYRPCNALQR